MKGVMKMKKMITVIIGLLFLTGCGSNSEIASAEPSDKRFNSMKITDTMFLLTDTLSNVQYLKVYRNSGYDGGIEIIPVFNEDGSPYVDKGNNENRFVLEKIDGNTLILLDKNTRVEYLIVYRNSGYDGGVSVTPLLQTDGSLYLRGF